MSEKLVAITGASAGIGKAAAIKFKENGYRLALIARRRDKLEALKEELGAEGLHIYELDVTSKSDVEKVFGKILKESGPVDILVNNAGGAFGLDKAFEVNLDDWEKCVDLNIKGLLYCTHAVLHNMVQRNRGHILNIGSVAGSYPYPGGNAYCGAKAFVKEFSLNLKADLLGTKVRVSCIEPGLVGGTEFSNVRFHGDAEKAKRVYEKVEPLTATDVAEAIFFAASVPEHVNINSIEMMPVCQSFSGLSLHKN